MMTRLNEWNEVNRSGGKEWWEVNELKLLKPGDGTYMGRGCLHGERVVSPQGSLLYSFVNVWIFSK